MASIALSTAGVTLKYCVETTAGTRPTTGFTTIAGVKSISDLNPQPNQLDCTPLEELEYKQYIPGLKDIGGVVTFKFNNTNALQTDWAALVTASETGATSDKATWFEVKVPNMTNSFYFSGKPSSLGLSAIEVDTVLEIDAYVTPNKMVGWAASST